MRSCRGGAGGRGGRGGRSHTLTSSGSVSDLKEMCPLQQKPGSCRTACRAVWLTAHRAVQPGHQPPTRALRPLPSDPRGRPARPRVGRRHSPGATETRGRLFSSAGRRGRRVSPGPSAAPTPTPREGTSHCRALQAPSGLTPPGTFVSLLPKGSSCPSGDPAPIPTAPRPQRPAGPGA